MTTRGAIVRGCDSARVRPRLRECEVRGSFEGAPSCCRLGARGSCETRRLAMKLRLRYALVWLLLVSVAACGSDLNRSQAAKAIADSINGAVQSTRIFRSRCVEEHFERYPIRFLEDTQTAHQHQLLADAGFAIAVAEQPTPEACGTPRLEHQRVLAIRLTAKGAAEHWPEHTERGGGWDIVLARRELVEVTGIVTESDLARAEFTWRYVPTAGGAALGPPLLGNSSPQRASATFQRATDGWRLLRIDNRAPGLREPLGAPAP